MSAPAPKAETLTLDSGSGQRLAVRHVPGGEPGVVWLHGFGGSMKGRKPRYLETWARSQGLAFTAVDLSGHGDSTGTLEGGTIGQWRTEVADLLDQVATGRQIVVGTSMGGWLAMLAAQDRPDQVAAVVGLAPAPDFPARIAADLSPAQRQDLAAGLVRLASDYDPEGTPLSRALVEDGATHALLYETDARGRLRERRDPIAVSQPVRLIHGDQDQSDPVSISPALAKRLTSQDVKVRIAPGGEHLLNRPEDMALLGQAMDDLAATLRPRARLGASMEGVAPCRERRTP